MTTQYEAIETSSSYTLRNGETVETVLIHTVGGQLPCPKSGVEWPEHCDHVEVCTELLVSTSSFGYMASSTLKGDGEQLYEVFGEVVTSDWGVRMEREGKTYRMRKMNFSAPTYSEALQLAQTRALADIGRITARLEARNARLAVREARAAQALVGMPFKAVETR